MWPNEVGLHPSLMFSRSNRAAVYVSSQSILRLDNISAHSDGGYTTLCLCIDQLINIWIVSIVCLS